MRAFAHSFVIFRVSIRNLLCAPSGLMSSGFCFCAFSSCPAAAPRRTFVQFFVVILMAASLTCQARVIENTFNRSDKQANDAGNTQDRSSSEGDGQIAEQILWWKNLVVGPPHGAPHISLRVDASHDDGAHGEGSRNDGGEGSRNDGGDGARNDGRGRVVIDDAFAGVRNDGRDGSRGNGRDGARNGGRDGANNDGGLGDRDGLGGLLSDLGGLDGLANLAGARNGAQTIPVREDLGSDGDNRNNDDARTAFLRAFIGNGGSDAVDGTAVQVSDGGLAGTEAGITETNAAETATAAAIAERAETGDGNDAAPSGSTGSDGNNASSTGAGNSSAAEPSGSTGNDGNNGNNVAANNSQNNEPNRSESPTNDIAVSESRNNNANQTDQGQNDNRNAAANESSNNGRNESAGRINAKNAKHG